MLITFTSISFLYIVCNLWRQESAREKCTEHVFSWNCVFNAPFLTALDPLVLYDPSKSLYRQGMSDPFDHDDPLSFEVSPQNQTSPTGEAFYLEGLNPAQREAVLEVEGPLLILAGAGTGKTRVLTTRLAHILSTGRAMPAQVLAVTFTNKAAKEMQSRVGSLLGRPAEGMAIGTFHSISARMLRKHGELVGLESNFTILDTDDQIRLLKQLLEARNIDHKRWPARALAGMIDRWKNKALLPDRVPEGESYAFANGLGGDLYKDYQDRLKQLNACDFGDLLLHMVTIFQNFPDVLRQYHNRYRYMMVDEYQDTNLAQYLWLRLLAQGSKNICCVGDDDQSIYGWRGAEVGNILKFEKDFPGAKIVRLEQNYRSTGHILGAATGVISANAGRLGKTLWTEGDLGEKVSVISAWDSKEEARKVGECVEDLQRHGNSLENMAVLVRAGFQMREFEERFITLGLPYRVIGGPRFYERAEIRDALAYLRIINQPSDDLALERIINVPKRGIGGVTVQKIHAHARQRGVPMLRATGELLETNDIGAKARGTLRALLDDFDRWRTDLETLSHVELAERVLEESGYVEMWQNDKAPDAPGRLENLTELINAMGEFENLQGFLEHISLVMEATEEKGMEKISIMTLHGSKGLEFDSVFLPGWEESIFPNQRALDETGERGLEEERRLAYVGITRAKKRATILFAGSRQVFGQWQTLLPSRFLEELPEDHVERESGTNAYGGGSFQRGSGGGWNDAFESAGMDRGFSKSWSSKKNYAPREKTLAEKRGQRSTIDGHITRKTTKAVTQSDFAIGERVFHEKFGYGLVEDVEGNKLSVNFEMSGVKRIVDSFVERA